MVKSTGRRSDDDRPITTGAHRRVSLADYDLVMQLWDRSSKTRAQMMGEWKDGRRKDGAGIGFFTVIEMDSSIVV